MVMICTPVTGIGIEAERHVSVVFARLSTIAVGIRAVASVMVIVS